jgi:glycosyltransferase involved in cell wall biosynthesis
LDWGISSYFGWGVYGLNLALHWARDAQLEPVAALPINPKEIVIDPLRANRLISFVTRSAEFRAGKVKLAPGDVWLHALGGNARFADPGMGIRSIGAIFFENELDAAAVERLKQLPLIVAGSSWNERLLRAYGLPSVSKVIQGVDTTLFHEAPKAGFFSDQFLVFSGGKAEARKGQDLVLAAFKRFAAKRRNALLVTAWHSPWPKLARTLDHSGLAASVPFTASGQLDVKAWAAASGINPNLVIDLGHVPNLLLPSVLREMDVGLFPNRAEGGTNLVAMECMACGVPVILSKNTGHLDLIDEGTSFLLERQEPTAGAFEGVSDVEGWRDSNPDEIVEKLEQAYSDREDAVRRGSAGAKFVSRFSWAKTATNMKMLVEMQ